MNLSFNIQRRGFQIRSGKVTVFKILWGLVVFSLTIIGFGIVAIVLDEMRMPPVERFVRALKLGNQRQIEYCLQRNIVNEKHGGWGANHPGYFLPIHLTAKLGNDSVLTELLKQGADPNSLDEGGGTPLMWIAQGGSDSAPATEKCIELLLAAGADVNRKCSIYGMTALHYAALGDKLKISAKLIQRGADVNAKDKGGDTPLHRRCYSSIVSTTKSELETLLNAGADPLLKNDSGQTAFDIASKKRNSKFLKLLKETVANAAKVHREKP